MKLSIFILTLLMAFAVSAGAEAAVSDGAVIAPENLAPLAQWVEKATHVSLPVLPVAIASNRKLEKALRLEDAQHAGAVGAYLPGRILISNNVWDADSLVAQSYVVHELVHHAQFVSGRPYTCHAAKEREAYMLQSQWLIEHGQKPLVGQAWIDAMSSCASADGRAQAY